MEGPERQLRPRLTDRLGGDDANRLADVDHRHGGEVATVAHPAEPTLGLAGEHRADLHRLDPRLLDRLRGLFIDHLSCLDEQLRATRLVEQLRIDDILRRDNPDDALRQRLDDILAFLQRGDLESHHRPAILLGDRHILRDVTEAAGEVAGVGGLERRVREALAGAVGRREVLEDREPLTEVRLDRVLDDLADPTRELLLRLGHQAAHPGQLTDLVTRATGARVEHHEDGVEAVLRLPHALDHRIGDVVVRVRPGVDDLIVALAVRDVPGLIRLLEPGHARRGLLEDRLLLDRDLKILDTDRHAPTGRVAEPELLQAVQEGDGTREPGLAVGLEDELAEHLLLHLAVLERQLRGDDPVEEHAPRGRGRPRRAALRRARAVSDRGVHVELAEGHRHLDLRR